MIKLLDEEKLKTHPYVCVEFENLCPAWKSQEGSYRNRCIFRCVEDMIWNRVNYCPRQGLTIQYKLWKEIGQKKGLFE